MPRFLQSSWESPVGRLRIVLNEDSSGAADCVGLYFADHRPEPKFWSEEIAEQSWQDDELTRWIVEQLTAYFADGRFRFDLPYRFSGTEFQEQVWRQLCEIPAGTTQSYREVADSIGRPAAVRAVGSAVARNPLSVLIPCHRVVASDGGLAGFAGGLARKRFLLDHETAAHQASRVPQSTRVTAPVATMDQPSPVSMRELGSRPVQTTRQATSATARATKAKHTPPTLAWAAGHH
ncbi:methylated-DNA--[protein]-cysteine S-methyltransferase [Allorhodopirellula solitaria]|uniref:methylated-DNA--[protein]-cysteine S-methyltransferase n=1 Tax=Allorhodopirellula solitaria TaxID=2527987 RepID=A0A5C5X1X2_9BACT|nr:methylated-DNA--[protein]-cysteine S-methyltransferase [Allorhodopirellula solitaria]TWT56163.1 Methylated-DNA--protein-cysteine methyltransferase, inducible [Allorhodopirellula solitaria]